MRATEILGETPQLITSLDSHDIRDTINVCLHNINNAPVVERYGSHTGLYDLNIGSTGYYFIADDSRVNADKIVYFVKYQTVEMPAGTLPNVKSVRQVLVWRNRDSIYTGEVAKEIFWEKLFPRFNCLVSDSQQSPDGKRFWLVAVKHALTNGLKVRIVNTNDRSFQDISGIDQFNDLESTTWGSANWFQRVIVAIFK